MDREAAPVHAHRRPLDVRRVDGIARDASLEGMRTGPIGRQVPPPVRRRDEHPRVLPRAVVVDPRRRPPRDRSRGFCNAATGGPRRSSRRTAATWRGSPLWDAHITAARSSGRSSGSSIAWNDTAPWTGFSHERPKRIRSGSPADATTRPSGSHTATSPRWIDSTRPLRTTWTRLDGRCRGARA